MSAMESNAQYTFTNAPIGGGGFVTGIVTHTTSGDRYCRTDVGGAYRWDAVNNKWVQLMDWLNESENGFIGVEALALDPQNANNIYMLCGTSYINNGRTAILKSTDKGNTFTYVDVSSKFKAHGNGSGRGNGERLAIDPHNSNILFCGTRANGLWKSTDAGVTWNQAWTGVTTTTNGNGICFVLYDTASSVVNGATQTIYIGVSRTGSANIYKSIDGGATFTDISATTSFMPHRAALQGTTMYVTFADSEGPATNGTGKVYKLNTGTGAWTDVTPNNTNATPGAWSNFSYGGVNIDPTNVNRVVISTCGMYQNQSFVAGGWGDFVFLSTNGGTNWTLKNGLNATWNNNGIGWVTAGGINWMDCIEFDKSNPNIVRHIGGGGVFACSDITATNPSWKYDVIGIEETAFLDGISIPGGPLITSFGDVTGFVHDPITSYPTKKLTPSDGNNQSIAYAGANPSKVVRASNGGSVVYYSSDMGATWTGCATNKGTDGRVTISADGGTIVYCPRNSTTTYYTIDNGKNWSACSGVTLGSATPVADQVNANYFYIYHPSTGQMYRSSNKGVSFSVAGTPGNSTVNYPWESALIRTVPGYEGHIWVPRAKNGLKYSTDYGATYTTVANVTYCKSVSIGKAISTSSYPTVFIWGTVSGVTGLFRSTDKGATWLKMNDDAHQYAGSPLLIGDMNVFGRVYMSAGGGRGIVYAQIQDCNGVWGGTAYLDSCHTCVGGNTGKLPCIKDCKGVWGGTDTLSCTKDCQGIWGGSAFIDSCKTCVGGTTGKTACVKDCNGVWNGTAHKDSCGICVGGNTGKTACTKDCNGVWGGSAYKDNCNKCVGGNTGKVACIKDCNNVWGGSAHPDSCQTCVGGNTGKTACVKDCNGVWGGTAYKDNCNNCVGGNTGKVACVKDCKGTWGGSAFIDNCAICIDTTKGEKSCATNVGDYKSVTFDASPNPFTHSLQLQLLKPSEYTIINTSGETVESGFCQNNCNIATNLRPGLYFLTIKNVEGVKTIKIIKL
jgi:hypothetical protein